MSAIWQRVLLEAMLCMPGLLKMGGEVLTCAKYLHMTYVHGPALGHSKDGKVHFEGLVATAKCT
jgi:hypothetical protein